MPSETDRFDGDTCFIITNPSAGRFHLYGDDSNELRINDIANAISKQVRFTGHLLGDAWYSVAEHCLLTAEIVREIGGSLDEQYIALMHDATEAYMSDIAAPFKREIGAGDYYKKEAMIWKRIAAKYGLPETIPDIVKEADWMALWIEARFCVVQDPETLKSWQGYVEHGGERSKTLKAKLRLYAPMYARMAWLSEYTLLRGV